MRENNNRKNSSKRGLWTRFPVLCIAVMLALWASLSFLSCEDPLDQLTVSDPFLVAGGSAGAIYHSDDGKTWTHAADIVLTMDPPAKIEYSAYGTNGFVVSGASSVALGFSSHSDDGYSWNTIYRIDPFFVPVPVMGTAYFNGIYFTAQNGNIFRSFDGTGWTQVGTGLVYCFAYGDGQYFGAGDTELYRSADGSAWGFVSGSTGYDFRDALYARGRFILVGNDGTNGTINVFDGGTTLSSTLIPGGQPMLRSITYGRKRFVAVGESSRVWRSADGYSWEYVDLPWAGVTIYDVVYANGLFVAACSSSLGIIYSEDDGSTWAPGTLTNGAFQDVQTVCRKP